MFSKYKSKFFENYFLACHLSASCCLLLANQKLSKSRNCSSYHIYITDLIRWWYIYFCDYIIL